MMLGHPWLTHRFVYITPGQLEGNFVLSLFVICIMFLCVYSCQFLGYFLIYYYYVYNVDFWYVSIHNFYIKGTDSHIFVEFNGLQVCHQMDGVLNIVICMAGVNNCAVFLLDVTLIHKWGHFSSLLLV
jgi:hypothetical protein